MWAICVNNVDVVNNAAPRRISRIKGAARIIGGISPLLSPPILLLPWICLKLLAMQSLWGVWCYQRSLPYSKHLPAVCLNIWNDKNKYEQVYAMLRKWRHLFSIRLTPNWFTPKMGAFAVSISLVYSRSWAKRPVIYKKIRKKIEWNCSKWVRDIQLTEANIDSERIAYILSDSHDTNYVTLLISTRRRV